MNKTTLLLAAMMIVVLALFATADSVQAQHFNWGGVNYPYAAGYFSSPYSLGQVPTPPYFALHPPVYYSRPRRQILWVQPLRISGYDDDTGGSRRGNFTTGDY